MKLKTKRSKNYSKNYIKPRKNLNKNLKNWIKNSKLKENSMKKTEKEIDVNVRGLYKIWQGLKEILKMLRED